METAGSIATFLASVICPSLDDVLAEGQAVFTKHQRYLVMQALENLEEVYAELEQAADGHGQEEPVP
jgi:hypothetical protein